MIRTRRLVLRSARQDDLADLHAIFSDARAMRFWSHETHETTAQTAQTLDGLIQSYAQTGLEFVLELDGRVIGKAGLWRMSEVGFILHPHHWGRGLMREALEAILPAAFRRYPDLTALTAETDPRNTASAALLSALGFVQTHHRDRTLFLYGEWCDSVYWRLDRPRR